MVPPLEDFAVHLLDSDQLRTFVAIAECGSFTRAGERVGKTQSGVSMQMKKLEEQLGRAIFARNGRGARLTEDGERLLEHARRILKLNEECLASFSDSELTGRVRLGVPDDYAGRYLPEIMSRFSAANPRVEVTIECEPTPNLLDRLREDGLDLAIITHVERRGPSRILRTERLLWVTSQRHTTHEKSPLPLALGRPTCDWRQSACRALEERGVPHRLLYVSWSSAAVTAAVLAGLAVSVLPESALVPGMRVLGPADGFPALPSCKIGLVRNARATSPLADALELLIEQSLHHLCERATGDRLVVAAERGVAEPRVEAA